MLAPRAQPGRRCYLIYRLNFALASRFKLTPDSAALIAIFR